LEFAGEESLLEEDLKFDYSTVKEETGKYYTEDKRLACTLKWVFFF
jgi:hypothetical protein